MTRARDLADRNFADNDKVVLGNGDDLEISHNATNSIIENKTGYLALRSQDGGQIRIEDATGNANALFNDNSDVKLRYNASDRLVTTSAGVTVTGTVTATSYAGDGSSLTGISTDLVGDTTPQLGGVLDTNGNNIEFPDSSGAEVNRLKFGASDDLQIYHSGTHSFIDDSGTGNLYIRSSDMRLQKYTGENMIVATADAAVTLYHNNSAKLATTSSGVDITGDITADNLATPASSSTKGSYQTLSRSTWTKITGFTTGEYDSDSAWDGSRFTVPSGEGGRYLITCNLHLDFSGAGGDGEQGIAAFYINGTRRQQFFRLSMNNGGRHMSHLAGTGALIYDLSAGQYVEVYAYMQDDSQSGSLQVRGSTNEGSRFGFMRIN